MLDHIKLKRESGPEYENMRDVIYERTLICLRYDDFGSRLWLGQRDAIRREEVSKNSRFFSQASLKKIRYPF